MARRIDSSIKGYASSPLTSGWTLLPGSTARPVNLPQRVISPARLGNSLANEDGVALWDSVEQGRLRVSRPDLCNPKADAFR